MQVEEQDAPDGSLITAFSLAEGHYTDAFCIRNRPATLTELVRAFYGSGLFRLERLVLRLTAGARSTDAELAALADGTGDSFAVWRVEGRNAYEILLVDTSGRTKSWLSVAGGDLWFGSVVVPVERRGKLVLGPVFDSLMGAHKVYSRALLAAAGRGLSQ